MASANPSPRAVRRTQRRQTNRGQVQEIRLRLSRQDREYLAFTVRNEGWRSIEDYVRKMVHSLGESENAFCLDPTHSEFRAWKVKHRGARPVRCGGGGPLCPPCARELADVDARLAQHQAAAAAEVRA